MCSSASTEAEVLAIGAANELANCSVTQFERVAHDDEVAFELTRFNDPVALERDAAPVTHESDVPLGPR